MAPHNAKEFEVILREVDAAIKCDVGLTGTTVRSTKKKEGELRIHGPGDGLARIKICESFIVEVSVHTSDEAK